MPKIENWSRMQSRETADVIRAWQNDETGETLVVRAQRNKNNELYGYKIAISGSRDIDDYDGGIKDEYSNQQPAIETATSWMKHYPYGTLQHLSDGAKENMSRDGFQQYLSGGFLEVQVPYILDGDAAEHFNADGKSGGPLYMTVDFVPPKEDEDMLSEASLSEREEYVSERLGFLVEAGYVTDIYGDPISSISEFKQHSDDIQPILARR